MKDGEKDGEGVISRLRRPPTRFSTATACVLQLKWVAYGGLVLRTHDKTKDPPTTTLSHARGLVMFIGVFHL